MKKFIPLLLCVTLSANLASCGTILYPERKGQIDGQLDTGVVILDAIGLLFFVVPGVIAFAVDFSNGTIYLPGSGSSSLTEDEVNAIAANGKIEMDSLGRLVSEKAALPELINSSEILVLRDSI